MHNFYRITHWLISFIFIQSSFGAIKVSITRWVFFLNKFYKLKINFFLNIEFNQIRFISLFSWIKTKFLQCICDSIELLLLRVLKIFRSTIFHLVIDPLSFCTISFVIAFYLWYINYYIKTSWQVLLLGEQIYSYLNLDDLDYFFNRQSVHLSVCFLPQQALGRPPSFL